MPGIFQNLIKVCRFSRKENDGGQFTSQQIEYMDKAVNAFVMMPYGLHANIPEDFLGVVFEYENNHLSFPLSTKERIKNLKSGEVILYHPVKKTFIKFNDAGDIEINTKGKVEVTAGDVTISGNLKVTGDCAITGVLTQNNIDVGSPHNHNQANDSGGDAQQPTGPVNP